MAGIDDLLNLKKISRHEYLLYQVFESLDQGREVLKNLMIETFNEEPEDFQRHESQFAFLDGRRSVVRDIYNHIEAIKKLIINKDQANYG